MENASVVTIKSSLPLDAHTIDIYSYDEQVSYSHQVETGFRASLNEDIFLRHRRVRGSPTRPAPTPSRA